MRLIYLALTVSELTVISSHVIDKSGGVTLSDTQTDDTGPVVRMIYTAPSGMLKRQRACCENLAVSDTVIRALISRVKCSDERLIGV